MQSLSEDACSERRHGERLQVSGVSTRQLHKHVDSGRAECANRYRRNPEWICHQNDERQAAQGDEFSLSSYSRALKDRRRCVQICEKASNALLAGVVFAGCALLYVEASQSTAIRCMIAIEFLLLLHSVIVREFLNRYPHVDLKHDFAIQEASRRHIERCAVRRLLSSAGSRSYCS